MAYALSQIGANACLLDGLGGMLAQQIARVRRNDVLFAVSFPRMPRKQRKRYVAPLSTARLSW
ncbi:MAG: hypothetical protein PF501_11565 [Salinisphaera sp.]|nr:hypothetical protein [Salinisphaera sp.]